MLQVAFKHKELADKIKGHLIERREVTTKKAAITPADLAKLDESMLVDAVLNRINPKLTSIDTQAPVGGTQKDK